MIRLLLPLLAMLWLPGSFAQDGHTMRRCVLLPITDGVGGAIATKVYAELESYLRDSDWCSYQSNSDLLGVFSRYRENLPAHLRTPEVLRVVADKLKAGSLIRLNIAKEIDGLDLQLEVMGANGTDLYFTERTLLKRDDVELTVATARNWLEMYGRTIPYDGKVIGVLGDQITVDVGRSHRIKIGQDYTVRRLKEIKRHPLLKKVVDWDSRQLASGKIFSVDDTQALGLVKVYRSESKIQIGDWVRLDPLKEEKAVDDLRYPEDQKESFGKLGMASLYFIAGSSNLSAATDGSKNRGNGTMLGVQGGVEAWITRNWFALFEMDRTFGTIGRGSSARTDYQRGTLKLGGGYKYLPLGFFYGPQVDFTLGLARNSYRPEFEKAKGYGEFGINGIFAGVGANLPVTREYRALVRAEFIPFPTFDNNDSVYGSNKSLSWLQLEGGVRYQYNPSTTLDALLEMTSAKASFRGDTKSVAAQDTSLKFGASFNF